MRTMVAGPNVLVIGPLCVTIKQIMTTCETSITGVNSRLLIARLSEDYVDARVNDYSKFGV